MNSEPESENRANRPPWLRFLLRMLILVGMIVLQYFFFSTLALFLVSAVFDIQLNEMTDIFTGGKDHPQKTNALKLIHSITTIGMFILPGFMFARMDGQPFGRYFGLKRWLNPLVWLIFIFLGLASAPFINWTNELNHLVELPGFLNDLQQRLGSENDTIIKMFLEMNGPLDFLVNIFIFGILAGLGEEIIFRGLLQRGLHNWLGNGHAAVWIAAAVFSFVHFDFMGFLPRLFLGALLGYAYWRTGNIIMPALMHCINNSLIVVGYWLQQKGQAASYLEENFVFPTEWVVVSGIILIGGLALSIFLTRKDEHALDEAL